MSTQRIVNSEGIFLKGIVNFSMTFLKLKGRCFKSIVNSTEMLTQMDCKLEGIVNSMGKERVEC